MSRPRHCHPGCEGWVETVRIGKGAPTLPVTPALYTAAMAAAEAGLYVRYEAESLGPLMTYSRQYPHGVACEPADCRYRHLLGEDAS